jgi:hypothetical protein
LGWSKNDLDEFIDWLLAVMMCSCCCCFRTKKKMSLVAVLKLQKKESGIIIYKLREIKQNARRKKTIEVITPNSKSRGASKFENAY